MSCWDRFDRKVVLYFTGNKDTRVPGMERELARVGLDDADRQWQFPSPLDKVLLKNMSHESDVEQRGYFNASMGHYRAIATAYHLGCSSVLVLEDDIRFLKDLSEMRKFVDSIPADYDVALLDLFAGWMKNTTPETLKVFREKRSVNECWASFDEMRSMGCYALSRKGMQKMLFAFEAVETARHIGKMRICDHFLDRKILGADTKMYFPVKNVAMQKNIGNANSNINKMGKIYSDMGVVRSEYAD